MTATQTRLGSANRSHRRSRPSAIRVIPVRRLDVDLTDAQIDRWLVDEDPVFSNFLATLSAVFPRGEEFFVATVRANREAAGEDETLRAQIKAFIGQEAMHGREHRRINSVLDRRGYHTARAEHGIDRILRVLIRLKPRTLPLAVTAAAEHLTGILAESALGSESTRRTLFAQPDVESLITWHALEELEHKNVAFDVFERASGSYTIRIAGFALTVVVLGGYVLVEWARSVYDDRAELSRERYRLHRRNLRNQTLLSPWSLRQLLKYLRPGFHPDDIDTNRLVEEWRDRLSEQTTITAGTRNRTS